jgi:RNA polymerase sigma-70 factor (ECF subfamily)
LDQLLSRLDFKSDSLSPAPFYSHAATSFAGSFYRSDSREPFHDEWGITGMTSSDPLPESELIHRAQAGDGSAFQTLADRHAEPLFRCALTLARDRQLAEDVAQETLFEAWRSLSRFDGRCRFSTWLYGILRHRFLKAIRRTSLPCVELPSDDGISLLHSMSDPSAELQRADDADRVRQAVAALLAEHRDVIELRFFADASLDDISAALDIPLGTVKSRLHNALEKLRQQKLSVNLFATHRESPTRRP